ncbi:MAG: hypothetical protein AAF567_23225 [Actinomycetota bacterium]
MKTQAAIAIVVIALVASATALAYVLTAGSNDAAAEEAVAVVIHRGDTNHEQAGDEDADAGDIVDEDADADETVHEAPANEAPVDEADIVEDEAPGDPETPAVEDEAPAEPEAPVEETEVEETEVEEPAEEPEGPVEPEEPEGPTPPQILCLLGYEWNPPTGECVFVGCPLGTSLQNGLCTELVVVTPCGGIWFEGTCLEVCPNGLIEFDGGCVELVLPVLCLNGFTVVDGECVAQCAPGQIRVGNVCQDLVLNPVLPEILPPVFGGLVLNG